MGFDVKTIYIFSTLAMFFLSFEMALVWWVHRKRMEGIGWWTLALLTFLLHLVLMDLRGAIPDFLSFIGANLAVHVSLIFTHMGHSKFRGLLFGHARIYAILLVVMSGWVYYYGAVEPNLKMRIIFLSLSLGYIQINAARTLLPDLKPNQKWAYRLSSGVLFFGAVVLLSRVPLLYFESPGSEFFDMGIIQNIHIMIAITSVVALVFSYNLLVSNRLEELYGAMLDERERDKEALEATVGERTRQLRELSRRLITAQEAERAHLARELHDDIGQRLSLFLLYLETLHLDGKLDKGQYDVLSGQIKDAMYNLRGVSRGLHPAVLDKLGLARSMEALIDEYEGRFEMSVDLADIKAEDIPHDKALCAYRIAQEILNNAAKHSKADKVSVSLTLDGGGLLLSIADNGAGMRLDEAKTGIGLMSVRERVALNGGTVDIISEPGKGVSVIAWIPLGDSVRQA